MPVTIPLLRDYRRAREAIKTLREESDVYGELARKEIHRLTYDVYGPKIRALENERDSAIARREAAVQKQRETAEAKIAEHATVVDRVERLLELLRMVDEGGDHLLPPKEVYRYYRGCKAPIDPISEKDGGVVCDDQYKRIVAYIVPNQNRVNCLSLVFMVSSIFVFSRQELTRRLRNYYISNVHHQGSGIYLLKEGPGADELLQYYRRLVGRGLPVKIKEWLEDHAQLEQDYQVARGLITDPKWLRLYLESRVHYYEHGYTGGTETPEYAAILKRLSTLDR